MVLGKLPVPGRPTIWVIVGQGPIALAVGAGWGLFGHFLSPLSFLLFLPLSGRRSQRAAKPKTTNQPSHLNVCFRQIFSQLYPTHSRSVYDTTGMILAILYRKVLYMLHA